MIPALFLNIALVLLILLQLSTAKPHGRPARRIATYDEVIGAIYVDHNRNSSKPGNVAATSSPIIGKRQVFKPFTDTKPKGGITYSPYNADSTCKDLATFLSDTAKLKAFSIIRLYGIDCNQVANGIAAAEEYDFQLFLGVYNIGNSDSEILQLISMVGNNWSLVHTVSVGNEAVNSGKMSAVEVASRVHRARSLLRAAGYNGPVVTVDTFVAIMNNRVLCDASDYVTANCHPFFDGNLPASSSGNFVRTQSQNLQNICGGKEVLITETGWPHHGNANRAAIPSPENQAAAISSIKEAMGLNVIYFTAFDDLWKKDNDATFRAEKYWGIQNLNF